jgi:hypothetical protein
MVHAGYLNDWKEGGNMNSIQTMMKFITADRL